MTQELSYYRSELRLRRIWMAEQPVTQAERDYGQYLRVGACHL